ncbi:MAG TPA: ABC transporter permease subunit [Euzebyales bacterium]|nr:ABC transporter permease subunit [Euzebyales bacterium]
MTPRARWHAPPHAAAWRLAGAVGFLALWQVVALLTPPFVVPSPAAVASEIVTIVSGGLFWPNFQRSLQTIAVGFAVAYGAGALLGVAMGASGWWDGFLRGWLNSTLMMPGLVVVVVATMMLGLGPGTAVVAVSLTAAPYAAITIAEGVRAAPTDLLDMARAFRVPAGRIARDVLLPATAPFLLTAARFVFSLCWQTTTLAEVIGGTRGVGFMMKRAFQMFDMTGFVAWCVTFFLFTIVVERVVIQRMIARTRAWRPVAVPVVGR